MRNFLKGISRRRFIQFFGSVAMFAPYAGRLHAQGAVVAEEKEYEILVRMLQLLFPHAAIEGSVYQDMAAHVVKVAKRDPANAAMLGEGLQQLNGRIPDKWLASAEAEQKAALEQITGTPVFGLIRVNALEYLYRDPRGWKVVGYEGSAIEHGGYINRGFNDIDWLPKS